MIIGFIGLGKMGSNMVERLLLDGHKVVVYDINKDAIKSALSKGAIGAKSTEELITGLPTPRFIWIMLPAGEITSKTIYSLLSLLDKGDTIIDGGNSYYKDSEKNARDLEENGLNFLDAGTSGGLLGLKIGYCLMVGGRKKVFQEAEPIFKSLASKNGYAYVGPSGSGHFVKMIHNGIEYGMLEAYAEGFELMRNKDKFSLDLEQISKLWNQGSVIRSWILELAANVFSKESDLHTIKGYVEDSGEGRWTVLESIEQGTQAPIIVLSLLQRFRSRQKESFGAKVIAALRNEFGGHSVKK